MKVSTKLWNGLGMSIALVGAMAVVGTAPLSTALAEEGGEGGEGGESGHSVFPGDLDKAITNIFGGEGGEGGAGLSPMWPSVVAPALTGSDIEKVVTGNTLSTFGHVAWYFGPDRKIEGGFAEWSRTELKSCPAVDDDAHLERVARTLAAEGFPLIAIVEQGDQKRIAIARLRSPSGIVVDLLAASSGIEREIVSGARETLELVGVAVATSEHLLAMKVLSMRDARLQDRIDARGLLAIGPIDLGSVRQLLALIETRGFARGQDLGAKLDALLQEVTERGS